MSALPNERVAAARATTTHASWRPDRDDLATAILAGMGTLGLRL